MGRFCKQEINVSTHSLNVVVLFAAGDLGLILLFLTTGREVRTTDLVEHQNARNRRVHGLEVALLSPSFARARIAGSKECVTRSGIILVE
jgi:hypothetical protein